MPDTDICNWCLAVFPADQALFDLLPDPSEHGRIVAACSRAHMLALGGHVYDTDDGTDPARDGPAASR